MADRTIATRVRQALAGWAPVRPPRLATGDERSASRLELFFDLAFVLVVAELAGALAEDLTPAGFLTFAGLFTTVWWSWVGATLYANRFDHDDVVYRLYKLGTMAAVIGLAATAAEATGPRFALFAGCHVVLRLLLFLQYHRAYRHVEAARLLARLFMAGAAVGALLWAVSPLVPRPVGIALWAAAVLAEALVPLVATRACADLPLHVAHLPERFALFVILVLGQPVAGIAHGVSDAGWTAPVVLVAVISFVLTAALWWSYFDLAGARAKRLLGEAGGERSDRSHDVYVFGHLPLSLALATVGVGLQLAVVEAGEGDVSGGTRLLLAGGVAGYLASAALTASGMADRPRGGWWWPLGAAVVAALDAAVELPAGAVVGALAALLVLVVLVGTAERSAGRLPVDDV